MTRKVVSNTRSIVVFVSDEFSSFSFAILERENDATAHQRFFASN